MRVRGCDRFVPPRRIRRPIHCSTDRVHSFIAAVAGRWTQFHIHGPPNYRFAGLVPDAARSVHARLGAPATRPGGDGHLRLSRTAAGLAGPRGLALPTGCRIAGSPQTAARVPRRPPGPGTDPGHSTTAAASGQREGAGSKPAALACDFAALPFPANSLDLVVLPHTLELHADPQPTLREVERVLVPEGRVVISGFNPASLWGLRQRRAHLYRAPGLRRAVPADAKASSSATGGCATGCGC